MENCLQQKDEGIMKKTFKIPAPAWNKMKDADGKTWYQSSFPLPIDTMLGFPEIRQMSNGGWFACQQGSDDPVFNQYVGSYKTIRTAKKHVEREYIAAANMIMREMLEDTGVSVVLVCK